MENDLINFIKDWYPIVLAIITFLIGKWYIIKRLQEKVKNQQEKQKEMEKVLNELIAIRQKNDQKFKSMSDSITLILNKIDKLENKIDNFIMSFTKK